MAPDPPDQERKEDEARAVMPALAGAARMPYPRFLAYNAAGGLTWAAPSSWPATSPEPPAYVVAAGQVAYSRL